MYDSQPVANLTFSAKRLLATWRIIGGLWLPRRWDISFNALTPYTTLVVPPENPFIKKKEPHVEVTGTTGSGTNLTTSTPSSSTPDVNPAGASRAPGTSGKKSKPERSTTSKPPKRRLIRHVLRARIEAAKALETFLAALQRDGGRVVASARLAAAYGTLNQSSVPSDDAGLFHGTRDVHEVLTFLRARGARFGATIGSRDHWDERWALSSGDEGTTHDEGATSPTDDEVVWVPRVVSRD